MCRRRQAAATTRPVAWGGGLLFSHLRQSGGGAATGGGLKGWVADTKPPVGWGVAAGPRLGRAGGSEGPSAINSDSVSRQEPTGTSANQHFKPQRTKASKRPQRYEPRVLSRMELFVFQQPHFPLTHTDECVSSSLTERQAGTNVLLQAMEYSQRKSVRCFSQDIIADSCCSDP